MKLSKESLNEQLQLIQDGQYRYEILANKKMAKNEQIV